MIEITDTETVGIQRIQVRFPRGTVVVVDGAPFTLMEDALVEGDSRYFELADTATAGPEA